MSKYTPELKDKVLRLYFEDGRTQASLNEEYHLGKGTLRSWIKQYREECQNNPEMQSEADAMAEIKKLKKELAEAKKENEFLKKAAAFFAKEIDQPSMNLLNITEVSWEYAGY